MNAKETTSKKVNKTASKFSKKCTPVPFESSLRSYTSLATNSTQRQTPVSSKLDITPNICKTSDPYKKREFASTPSKTSILPLPVCDESVIEAADQHCMPSIKEPFSVQRKTKVNFSQSRILAKKTLPLAAIDEKRRKEKIDDETSARMSLLYCKAVQAAYLVSQAKKCQKAREQFALEKLQNLWRVNQLLLEQEKTLNTEVKNLEYMNEIYDYCEKEKKLLDPVLKELPDVMQQYKEISEAVDKIRHKLHAPGVVPLDINLEGEISQIVNEVHNLLINFFKNIACDHTQISEVESLLVTVKYLVNNLHEEVQRCLELLSKSHHLAVNEISLKICKKEHI